MDGRRARRPVSMAGLVPWVTMALALSIACEAHAVGFDHNENFIVFAPDQSLAETVLAKAVGLRKQIAEEWFEEELPSGNGRTLIHVELSDSEDSGLTWVKDPKDPRQTLHRVWLTTTRDRALGSMLAHEMTHAVFATRFPDRLHPWIEEGIASLHDDPGRAADRRRILRRYAQQGSWPRLGRIIGARRIVATDDAAYCVGPSVVQYLLSRGDKADLIRFAVAAKEKGCEQALRECYGFAGVQDLQLAWQAWASKAAKSYAYAAPRRSTR